MENNYHSNHPTMDLTALLCSENLSQVNDQYHYGGGNNNRIDYNLEVQSQVDQALLLDERVLNNMLAAERRDNVLSDYCNNGVQTLIKPHMRKIVADWLLEVCEDQCCAPAVFHLAVSYMDRFLSQCPGLDKKFYQCLASGCLLLASKFSEVRPITTEKLSLYTDYSVLPEELKHWELKILNVLNWELSAVTAQSFIEHFIQQQQNIQQTSAKLATTIQRHAEILAATAATEYKFLMVRPSLMAAAALSAACQGLNSTATASFRLPKQLAKYGEQIEILVCHLESLLQAYTNSSTVVSEPSVCGSLLNLKKRKEDIIS